MLQKFLRKRKTKYAIRKIQLFMIAYLLPFLWFAIDYVSWHTGKRGGAAIVKIVKCDFTPCFFQQKVYTNNVDEVSQPSPSNAKGWEKHNVIENFSFPLISRKRSLQGVYTL